MTTTQINIHIPTPMYHQIVLLCAKRKATGQEHNSQKAIVVQALKEYLENEEEAK